MFSFCCCPSSSSSSSSLSAVMPSHKEKLMCEPFDRLPSEICSTIFSFLKQSDCLEMLCVCHAWYVKIPDHAGNMWKEIDFHEYGKIKKKSSRFLQFLGPHVDTITVPYGISGEAVECIFDKLKQRQCTFTQLTITNKSINRSPEQIDPFFSMIRSFGEHLVQLTLLNTYDISLLELARAFPRLTYLHVRLTDKRKVTIEHEEEYYQEREDRSKTREKQVLLPDLLHLTLDVNFHFSKRIMPLLYHCPNLRVLQLPNEDHAYDPPASFERPDNIDLKCILTLCPYLYCLDYCYELEADAMYANIKSDTIFGASSSLVVQKSNQPSSLHRLTICDDDKGPLAKNLIPFLAHTQGTLSLLNVFHGNQANAHNKLWHSLNQVDLSHLQELSIYIPDARKDVTEICSFLDKYHGDNSSLTRLNLRILPFTRQKDLLYSSSGIRSLKHFSLYALKGSHSHDVQQHDYSWLENFQGALQQIVLAGDFPMSQRVFQALSTLAKSLRTVELRPPVSGPTYQVQQWQRLQQNNMMIDDAELLNFISSLRHHNIIQSLVLENVKQSLDDTLMGYLGTIDSLVSLKISASPKIQSSGLQTFVDKKVQQQEQAGDALKGGKRALTYYIFQNLEIDMCPEISTFDVQYAKNKLGSNKVHATIISG